MEIEIAELKKENSILKEELEKKIWCRECFSIKNT
jgi:hypothetical protein